MVRKTLSIALITLLAVASAGADETIANRPSIEGTVTGPTGNALASVRVDVSTAAPRIGRGIFCPSCYPDCGKSATTDKTGRFRLGDLDPSLKFRLVLTAPGHVAMRTDIIDPLAGPVSLTLKPQPDPVDASRLVSGLVTQGGRPVVGALVSPHGAKTGRRRWWGRVKGVNPTVTDVDGRFQMTLPGDFLAIDIEVTGPGLCGEQLRLLEPGGDPVRVEARSGASVVGRLTHGGLPAREVTLAVVQLERGSGAGIFIAAVGDVTDDEGRFEFHHLPPDQRYCIYSVAGEARRSGSPHILTTKTFTVPPDGETRDLGTLEVAAPRTISGVVRRLDDQPLPRNLKISFGRDPAWDLISVAVQEDGSFAATGLPPETYAIRVTDPGLTIVADEIPFQMLSEVSFGVRLRDSIEDLVIPVRGK